MICLCPRCDGYGTACATCGKTRKRRPERSSDWGGKPHRTCKRRPGGIVECPEHEAPKLRCDSCGLCIEIEVDVMLYGVGAKRPAAWTQPSSGVDACPTCTGQRAVVLDAVGDPYAVSALGGIAFNKLLDGLKRLDVATLTPAELSQLRCALDIAVGAIHKASAVARHARRHPATPAAPHSDDRQ